MSFRHFVVVVCTLAVASSAAAQNSDSAAPSAMIIRNDAGVTMRAVRLDRPLALDGSLDEQIYSDVPAVGGFIQMEPVEGESPAVTVG